MFLKKYGDLIVSIFYTIVSVAMLILASMLPKSKVMAIGPDFMPTVIGILTLALSVILLIQTIGKLRKGEEVTGEKDNSDYKRVLASLILATIYVNILMPVGFIISTLLYLVLQITVLAPDDKRTKKDLIKYAIITVVFTLVVYFLFRYGFKIILPQGILKF
ncbi:MAG: tripartite tricarboxylate transporter TctB family protein [Clostridia bacterium]|nr:tripartite tricarboxylate transporter TctB family protein [Clostridia bacterium]